MNVDTGRGSGVAADGSATLAGGLSVEWSWRRASGGGGLSLRIGLRLAGRRFASGDAAWADADASARPETLTHRRGVTVRVRRGGGVRSLRLAWAEAAVDEGEAVVVERCGGAAWPVDWVWRFPGSTWHSHRQLRSGQWSPPWAR